MEESTINIALQPRKSKRFILVGFGVGLVVVVFLGWWIWPWFTVWSMHLAEKTGEASSRAVCDRIVAHGDRAVPAIISSIETNSPWVRRHCYLPIALKEIGGSAQPRLLQAINRQSDPTRRACLVSSLHTAFGDFSRFRIVLNDIQSGALSEFVVYQFESDVREAFPEAPPLMTEDRILNPTFLDWWRTNRIVEEGEAGKKVKSF